MCTGANVMAEVDLPKAFSVQAVGFHQGGAGISVMTVIM